jgi:hypothetical protein
MPKSPSPEVKYEIDDDGAAIHSQVEVDQLSDDDVKPEVDVDVEPEQRTPKTRKTAERKPKSRAAATEEQANSDAETDYKPAKRPRTPRAGGAGKRWSGPELEALFLRAIQTSPNFDGAVPGRTANQCSQTWR